MLDFVTGVQKLQSIPLVLQNLSFYVGAAVASSLTSSPMVIRNAL